MSRPILVGFLNGIALSIFVGQLSKVFDIPARGNGIDLQLLGTFETLPKAHLLTVGVSFASLALLSLLLRFLPRLPGALVVLAAAAAAVAHFKLESAGDKLSVQYMIVRCFHGSFGRLACDAARYVSELCRAWSTRDERCVSQRSRPHGWRYSGPNTGRRPNARCSEARTGTTSNWLPARAEEAGARRFHPLARAWRRSAARLKTKSTAFVFDARVRRSAARPMR